MNQTLTLLGDKLGTTVMGVFDAMQWAEDEIEQAKRRDPEHADLIGAAFGLLCPPPGLHGKSEAVNRLHMRTVLARVPGEGDTLAATPAEIACVVSDVSLRTPLKRTATWIMWCALRPIMQDAADLIAPQLDDYERNHEVPDLILDAARSIGKAVPPTEEWE